MIKRQCPACFGRGYHLAGIPGPIEFVLGLFGSAAEGKDWKRCKSCNGKGWEWVAWRDHGRR